MTEKKLIAFDYDGVLVDSSTINLIAWNHTFQEFGLDMQITHEHLKHAENMTFQTLCTMAGIPQDKIERFRNKVVEYLIANKLEPPFFPKIVELIPKLFNKYQLAVVTGNNNDNVKRVLKNAGIEQYFSFFLGGESETKAQKLNTLAEQQNLEKSSIYMIGDAISDIRQAKIAGVHSIAVSWGYQSPEKLNREHPDKLATTPDDFLKIFHIQDCCE